ncbi:glycosyltransferase family 39 protein [Roseivirga sp. E12]|uniref:ArnT family glycosyltransferase n=1 Tax=Roseivirga sp. E12 TaxID=2819237 RepID=UPI001ABD1A75|nr:glycosyltransferase family 39 protein [Roseivirga sp. E12]MBO3698539.1 glycosyltransferase family 39 protein [Roseivirga sp. E12]
MNKFLDYIALDGEHKKQTRFLMLIIALLYLFNFHVNDIWTPNESFYAEAVREMFESGNFLEIFYNYEPRYNKPPLTYWLIATSSSIFGLNEFAIRLPIVLMALGSIWFTYLIGRQLYGNKGGLYAMIMMAFSVQLLAVKQYASPEIPLTFFFTLTMYYFLKGFELKKGKYMILAFAILGLTVLTKGFPYIIVIGGIIGLYVLLKGPFKWQRIWDDIKLLKLHLGIPITLLIGLSWVIFMYIKDGAEFWEIYYRETFGRALSKKTNGPKPFFYLEVISWSILPYSLVFFFALIKWIRDWKRASAVLFPICWFIVMFIVFTIAKGKIPTYMIQAHPAMLLMIVPLLLQYEPKSTLWKAIWSGSFLFPAVLIIAANVIAIQQLNLHPLTYLAPALGLAILIYFHFRKVESKNQLLVAAPFWIILLFLFCFATVLPRLEKFRPYDEIGQVLNESTVVSEKTPILIEATLIHNIPYYAKRFAQRDMTPEQINNKTGETLALIRDESLSELSGFELLWSGFIYDFPSESQFAKFIIACIDAENGDLSKFAKYHLVHRNQ